ncbi:MAG TPA: preprotein translocase subunit YajC [Candidatus Azoamicus sp. OHIO1]
MKIILVYILTISSNLAYADTANDSSGMISSLLMFGGLFVLMYFLLIRPQTKKAKDHKNLTDNLKINDEIITTGGFVGKIAKIHDQFVIISLNDNINAIVKKESITNALPKGTIKQITL